MEREFEGKKLLILGGNPETIPLVEIANNWGIKTIVASARHTDPAKAYAWKAYDFEGLDADAVINEHGRNLMHIVADLCIGL